MDWERSLQALQGKTTSMKFKKIDYLTWARHYMGRFQIDLAKSNVKAVSKEELGAGIDHIELGGPHEDGCDELYELLAQKYGVERENVFVTNGATQAIFLTCAALLEQGDRLLLETPNYEPLYRVPLHFGAEITNLERRFERGFQIDLEEVERKVSRSTSALIMTNLHNPSGASTNPDKLLTIGQILREGNGHVLCCESYLEGALEAEVSAAVNCGQNLISIGSLSKIYGLGGVRGGWIIAPEKIINRCKEIGDYISGGTAWPTQTLTLHALKNGPRLVERTKTIVRENLSVVRAWIEEREEIEWFEPEGGTVALLKMPHEINTMKLSNLLKEKYSTLLVPGDFFSMHDFVRISIGGPRETLEKGLQNIAKAVDDLKSSNR